MIKRSFRLLSLLLVFSLLFSGVALAEEAGQETSADQGTEEITADPIDDMTLEMDQELSDLETSEPAEDLVSDEPSGELPSPEEGSVEEAAELAEEIAVELPAAQRLHAAVMELQGTEVWDGAHLVAVAREINRVTRSNLVFINTHPRVHRAMVLLTDETVRLAHHFVVRNRVKLAVYKNAAQTYAMLGCYRRAAAVTEMALRLLPDRAAGYENLKQLYRHTGSKGLKVFVRGQRPNLDVPPTVQNGRALVPLRAISETLGADVNFNARQQKITIVNGGININLYVNNRNAEINDRKVLLDQPARVTNGRALVPLRFVSEQLGAQANYDAQSGTITVE
jgi:tetratricopeptide (TPR) repeat protein